MYKHRYFIVGVVNNTMLNSEVNLEKPIRNLQDILLIQKFLAEKANVAEFLVTNYIKFEDDE